MQVGQNYESDMRCEGGNPALCAVKRSAPFQAGITYGRPIVASYTVAGAKADNLDTGGGESLLVLGANFGPAGTPGQAAE